MAAIDTKYNEICEKLGFIPSELEDNVKAEEDDSIENPFSVLTPEEIMYLLNGGFLAKKSQTV